MATIEQVDLTETSLERLLENERPPDSRLARFVRRVPTGAWKYVLVLSDMALIVVAFVIAYALRYQLQWFRVVEPVFNVSLAQYGWFLLALLVILPFAYYLSDVYPYRRGRSWVALKKRLTMITTMTPTAVAVAMA